MLQTTTTNTTSRSFVEWNGGGKGLQGTTPTTWSKPTSALNLGQGRFTKNINKSCKICHEPNGRNALVNFAHWNCRMGLLRPT